MSDAWPEALLFDLDGTLVDTAPDLACATNALRAHHGLEALPYEVIRPEVSNGGSALVELALGLAPSHADHGEARRFLLEAYGRDVARYSRVFPGLEPLLQAWDRARRPWGIVTNKPRAYAAPLVEALNLTHGVLLAADDLPVKKPDPAPLLEAARRLGVAPGDCWYIGDHCRDMQAARAAGMWAVAVRYGYIGASETPDTWPVDRWFETPESLTRALGA
ncbi:MULTISPECIES: HAD-IA family hydrolase [Chromohalobacter]|uniref:Phosphoglycolate phosphatase n=1 Tax=Chromohalobacter israelensis (strain ATCC BAA-138 / DSM 3043 / CIP 106854 / NCIMB 13768 / 1H11) TaxID=290398 RepID=Q1QWE9_CHRI1|nr:MULTISPECIES: HAD-IA family hydrolase [Chromohalobacter]ABE59209.1 phosphoglycolate phosphatase [Chromohalobacter salexigens DSM 3043]MBZ5877648.1 HAD-IA family hydrolase [Chromohalobacter salexigens]MDF9435517.1 HAD-IA family hydrolase [Chromohalobacter israelensis]NQY46822.1 HAD-IA family hydrolase [Chromohalobacter sp.]NWO56611.1 phosphoglycolate phosphatase [Chromohalobacter salexigens]